MPLPVGSLAELSTPLTKTENAEFLAQLISQFENQLWRRG